MRRMAVILAFVAPFLVVAPASAHTCAIPTQVPVGQPITVNLGVPAEAQAVTMVEVQVPDGFDLTEAATAPGWQVRRQGQTVTYEGGLVAQYGCGYFTLRGTATEKGRLVFSFTLRTVDGGTLRYAGDQESRAHGQAQYVFAGVKPYFDVPSEPRSKVEIVGFALIALGVVSGIGLAVKRSGLLDRLRRHPQADHPTPP